MLTRQDISTLIEAVEAWEHMSNGEEAMESFVTMAMCRSREEVEQVREQLQPNKDKREREAKSRKERSVLLRAKLIQMRDEMDAAALFNQASQQS